MSGGSPGALHQSVRKELFVDTISPLAIILLSRQAHQTPGVEMESMESVPMTTGADARGEDTEIHLHGLGGSGDAEASRGRSEGPALLQPERT